MANTVKWASTVASRGNVLSTELNSLANAAFTAAGTAYDNTSNLDEWFWFEFVGGGSITPTAGAYIAIYAVNSLDATNYDDAPSANDVGFHALMATIALQTTAHTVRALTLTPVQLPPTKIKFVVKNGSGVTLTATGNVLKLYSANEAVG